MTLAVRGHRETTVHYVRSEGWKSTTGGCGLSFYDGNRGHHAERRPVPVVGERLGDQRLQPGTVAHGIEATATHELTHLVLEDAYGVG